LASKLALADALKSSVKFTPEGPEVEEGPVELFEHPTQLINATEAALTPINDKNSFLSI